LDKKTGKLLWQSKDATDEASYSSPVLAEIGGVKQIVQGREQGESSVSPSPTAKVLWRYDRSPAYDDCRDRHAARERRPHLFHRRLQRRLRPDQGDGKLAELSPRRRCIPPRRSRAARAAWSSSAGNVFGHSEKGGWACQDFATGKVKWSETRDRPRLSVARGTAALYCVSEKGGSVALVEPNAEGWMEAGRFKLPREFEAAETQRRPLDAPPFIANGKLYVRDQELLFCFDVKK